jgi:cobalt-zinc-cadmium efflux system membrane fusion protein
LFAGLLFATFSLGCGRSESQPASGDAKGETVSQTAGDHSGWWCVEHGVPESVCGLCDSKLAAEMQKKGDWCREHDRPDSQCFACHPDLEAQFAAQYEAKYGTKPPKPEG